MNADDLVVAYTTNNPLQAEIIKNFLVEEGIPCDVAGEGQMGLAGIIEVQLMVRESDVQRARELIEEHLSVEPDWEDEDFDTREEE